MFNNRSQKISYVHSFIKSSNIYHFIFNFAIEPIKTTIDINSTLFITQNESIHITLLYDKKRYYF